MLFVAKEQLIFHLARLKKITVLSCVKKSYFSESCLHVRKNFGFTAKFNKSIKCSGFYFLFCPVLVHRSIMDLLKTVLRVFPTLVFLSDELAL